MSPAKKWYNACARVVSELTTVCCVYSGETRSRLMNSSALPLSRLRSSRKHVLTSYRVAERISSVNVAVRRRNSMQPSAKWNCCRYPAEKSVQTASVS